MDAIDTQTRLQETALYREAELLYRSVRQPGRGKISDAAEIHASPDGRHAVFCGTVMDTLEGDPPTRICEVDLDSGAVRILTAGPNNDRLPKYSPDGRYIAFLSDRGGSGNYQLYLIERATDTLHAAHSVEGWIEYLHWSPDSSRILLGVAGHGADVSGGQGAIASKAPAGSRSASMPKVETGTEEFRWRYSWMYVLAEKRAHRLGELDRNIWEAVWCGDNTIAAIVSSGPGEGLWYHASLQIIDVHTGDCRVLHEPEAQLGWPAACPSGKHLAIVSAICSDRWLVAGDVLLFDVRSGKSTRIDTDGVDVTCTEWRSERELLLAGQRGFETVIGWYDLEAKHFRVIWQSTEITAAGRLPHVSGSDAPGDCVMIGEGFRRAPEVVSIRNGEYRRIASLDLGYAEQANAIAEIERSSWRAPDGLEIQGWLLRPAGAGPQPLVLNIHGGPVSHWRPMWLGRPRTLPLLLLVQRGYAVLLPNPRGSSGRGRDFARRVVGDMGGADTYDFLSGIEHLVQAGRIDPMRLGVMGISYGGYMASWLITQDPRFAAAIPVAPVTNHVTEYLLSNIPHFVKLFLSDRYDSPAGKYFERSPIMHAHRARTPTLNICGGLDRCTPPTEAGQFHAALLEHGVRSVLVTYPEEGHGVRKFPAAIDYAARVAAWFESHMPAVGSR